MILSVEWFEITNLDKDEFSIQDIKELYHLRCKLETSYRELKYDLDLKTLHAKKRNLIEQQIYAKMLVYNFCSHITNGIDIAKRKRKYKYQFDFIWAFHIIRKHLKRAKVPSYIYDVIAKEILPIRKDWQNKRKLNQKALVSFNYHFDWCLWPYIQRCNRNAALFVVKTNDKTA